MKRFFFALAFGLGLGRAAPSDQPAPLAPGIIYAQDFSVSDPPETQGIVYDFRTTPPEPEGIARASQLTSDSAPLSVVLLGTDITPETAAAFAARSHRVILLAPIGSDANPDVAVPVTPAEVSAAVEAIRSGADLANQASPEIAKRRFDEATLVRRHHGTADPERTPPTPAAPSPVVAETEDPEATVSPPHPDLMLQRAVQILQGLHALGRG